MSRIRAVHHAVTTRSSGISRAFAASFALWASLACLPGRSEAAFSYGYAEQSLTGLKVTGSGLSAGTLTSTATSASAVANGVGVATNNVTDTPLAYVGGAPVSPQNAFIKYSSQGGGPMAADFTRGDSLITSAAGLFSSGANAIGVAESILSTTGTGSGLFTASGSWTIAGSFTSTGTSVSVGYSYANDILASTNANGTATASFGVQISIKDQHGHEVDASPVELNTAFSAPPNGAEIITSGSGSVTLSLAGLTAGDTYSIAISGTQLSSASISSVPEPSSLTLCGIAGVAGLGVAWKRRNRLA